MSEAEKLFQTLFDINDNFGRIILAAQTSYSEVLSSLTVRQHRVIKEIKCLTDIHPEGIPLKELAGVLNLSPATASELVESLVRRKLLDRNPCPEDRRAIRITLSPVMQEIIEFGKNKLSAICTEILSKMEKDEKEKLFSALDKIKNNIKEYEV